MATMADVGNVAGMGKPERPAVVVARRYALEPLREALYRGGQSQVWLRGELERRGIASLKLPLLYAYLGGYARIPAKVLSGMCWITKVDEASVTDRVQDTETLIQQPKGRRAARKRSGRKPRKTA